MLTTSMKINKLSLVAIFALLALQVAGCGEPPQPVDAPQAASKGGMPAGHPPMAANDTGEEARVSGTIVFEGSAFDNPTGTLFVSVRLKGMKAPWLSRKYPLTGAKLVTDAAGGQSMAFDLRSRDPNGETFNLNGQHVAPSECEVYACYKTDGTVESKTLADAMAVFQSGKSDYTLTLKLP